MTRNLDKLISESMFLEFHYTPDYSTSEKPRLKYFRDNIQGALDPKQNYKLLDIGCSQLDFANDITNLESFGLDIVDSDLYDKAHFKKVNLDHNPIPFEDQTFDFVVAGEVLEHVKRPYEMLDEIYRVLKPGGVLYLSTPTPHYYVEIIKEFFGVQIMDTPDHLNLFGRIHLTNYCKNIGFELLSWFRYKFWIPLIGPRHIIILCSWIPPLFGYQIIYKFRRK